MPYLSYHQRYCFGLVVIYYFEANWKYAYIDEEIKKLAFVIILKIITYFVFISERKTAFKNTIIFRNPLTRDSIAGTYTLVFYV